MLFILYGAASEMGHKSIEYLKSKGLEYVQKYAYCDGTPKIESYYAKRNYIPKKAFEEITDSLFRYSISNVTIGFDWPQITDAVYSKYDSETKTKTKKKNMLLTLATPNTDILKKIKTVYPNDVKIIYCYIDTLCLENLFIKRPNTSDEEYGIRMALGKTIKDCYTTNTDLFDYTVIYNGESSVFDYNALYKQYDAILNVLNQEDDDNETTEEKYDIFIYYSGCQTEFAAELAEKLQKSGIKIISPHSIQSCESFIEETEKVILNSKVYVPILSDEALKSEEFTNALKKAIDASKDSGTVIYPVIFGDTGFDWQKHSVSLGLEKTMPYRVNRNNYDSSICFINDWFSFMFSAEESLGELSEKIKDYVTTGLIDIAAEKQLDYIAMLKKYLSAWRKKDDNTLISARIRYFNLLYHCKKYDESKKLLNEILPSITNNNFHRFENDLANMIFRLESTENYRNALDKININSHTRDALEKKLLRMQKEDVESVDFSVDNNTMELADKIANYGKSAVELFEALFKNGLAPGYKETLMSAYDRILGYCKSVNLGNEISATCIDKISELKKSVNQIEDSDIGKNTLQSLKVYLGQALPDTGNYDVFISHKSADDAIATKVYEHLKQSGKVAFCDHFTLRELHDSEYDKRIVEAIENSKHMIVVSSNPEFLKDNWVYSEWHRFYNEKRLNNRNGNLILVLSDKLLSRIGDLPSDLRDGIEIIKTSEFRDRINDLLW